MRLYIDLTKALGQVSAVGQDQKDGARAARAHKESFSRTHPGVSGGDPTKDDPEVGRRWRDEGDEEDDKTDSEVVAQAEKSQEAVEMLKSLTGKFSQATKQHIPNPRELEYLTTVCGYAEEDVYKGLARIDGAERSRFNRWLNDRLMKSISRLL
ncbi:hypothetical protein HC928_00245 [bacterium]|nr:hypothetical protein [bacterium]